MHVRRVPGVANKSNINLPHCVRATLSRHPHSIRGYVAARKQLAFVAWRCATGRAQFSEKPQLVPATWLHYSRKKNTLRTGAAGLSPQEVCYVSCPGGVANMGVNTKGHVSSELVPDLWPEHCRCAGYWSRCNTWRSEALRHELLMTIVAGVLGLEVRGTQLGLSHVLPAAQPKPMKLGHLSEDC
ncbi:hypothetical protein NDU88_005354 [Pleurodeles waltl]|uniref:Uncharacterized protein n=1 Tax=Pleurodeles waltl TaxID=8319 RepID=A0AAV7QFQ2_PLEWA|nr:hypothetical protein NDU88_005354 [Pleurodeles waltl]